MQTLIRLFVFVLLFMSGAHSLACECRISGNVSKYLKSADIVFLGKVIFTDDDGTGTFVQKTHVHFEVEEAFKGLAAGVHDVWADPGSFTSCYAEYRRGERYLVFAHRGAKLPGDTAAMTIAPAGRSPKPLPAGLDAANPPVIYTAPECTGTLPVNEQTQKRVSAWLKNLRDYRKHEEKSAAKS
jgi:hypothetical protein